MLLIFISCIKKSPEVQIEGSSIEDSLSSYLSKANDVNAGNNARQEYIQKAFEIIIQQENDSLQRVNLFRVANRYYNLNDWKNYKEVSLLVLEKAINSKDTLSIAKAYSYLGDYYGSKSVSDTAFLYYFRAEKIYIQKNQSYNLARTSLNKAQLQYNESDFVGCENSAFKALRALKGESAAETEYELYNLLGLVNNELDEYQKAIEYHNKALASLDKNPTPVEFQSLATSMNNIGLVHLNNKQYKKAIPYFEKGLEQKNDLIIYKPFVYALLLENLGYSRFKINDSKNLPGLFYESLKLRDSLGLTTGVIISQIHLSEYFASKGDLAKALQYSNEAMLTAKNSKNKRNYLLPLMQLAIIEPQKASEYNKEYIYINDSLQKAERKIAEKFSRIEYETDEIKQENTDLTVQNRNLVYIFGSSLIVGLFLYIIKAQKAKNRELLYKQEQQRANEEIYNLMISQQNDVETIRVIEKKRVAQELHDGVLGRMFGVRMNLDGLNNFNDELGAKQRNDYLIELRNIEQDIREISHDLSREKSDLINNFVAILDKLLEEQKKTYKPNLFSSIDSNIKWDIVSNAIKINLYRIVQESIQNINKYANAHNIYVEFKKGNDNSLLLSIRDDGAGFNINKKKKGIGLQNMLSRINECAGTLEIDSKIGEGTKIMATVPLKSEKLN